ncbi:efflux RND transporter periplasmic adaptor subunit [Parvibaculum sp.]|uniref:efflux RND transporter periplasmic adaptor subunit n=1 Tax=Parvibaculum sp. TaxID=2024848 RepID=UPI0032107FF4
MLNRWIWIGVAVAVCLAVGAFFLLRPPAVAVTKPERGLAVEAVYATGTVEPRSYAETGSKISGRVIELKAKEGDRIAAGDVLAVIDLGEDAANVDQLQAKLKLAEADAVRARKLRRSGNVSIAALDQAESALGAADAALKSAKAKLEDHYIRAPIAGVVLRSEQQLKVGDMVQPQQTLFIVGDPSALQIDAEVDEEDITKVKPGQEALIRADAFNGEVLRGTVADITPYGDPVARTYRVHIALPSDTPLLSGMTTEINIVVRKQENALLVPVSALSGGAVWTIVDGRAVQVKVELGAVAKDKAEIRTGLGDRAIVILNPPSTLKPGARLRVATP